ncbi:hypothetical protein [Citreimonas sp.]|uniref:hypothetical protein n=1 Tax=Citreimonas sp. TaxID=3036715 RepID=UPI0035C78DD8
MPVESNNKERVRALLKKANMEIGSALTRVDNMGEYELAEAAGAAEATRAFFDFNGSCGSESVTAPTRDGTRAFFDFNGSCGGSSISDARRGEALVNALRDIMR